MNGRTQFTAYMPNEQTTKLLTKPRPTKKDAVPPTINHIIPLCIEFDECPSVEQLVGLFWLLKKNNLSFSAFTVFKNPEAHRLWQEKMQEVLDIVGSKNSENVTILLRNKPNWQKVKDAVNTLMTASWDNFEEKFREMIKYAAHNFKKNDITEEKLKYAQTKLKEVFETNIKEVCDRHPDWKEEEVRSHLLDEAVDCISFMQSFLESQNVFNRLLYKKDFTPFVKQLFEFVYMIGYNRATIAHVQMGFEDESQTIDFSSIMKETKGSATPDDAKGNSKVLQNTADLLVLMSRKMPRDSLALLVVDTAKLLANEREVQEEKQVNLRTSADGLFGDRKVTPSSSGNAPTAQSTFHRSGSDPSQVNNYKH